MMSDTAGDYRRGRRLAAASVTLSLTLAVLSIAVGLSTGSRSVIAIGTEFAGDVLSSALVLAGMLLAARPPDANHPYGHGRLETLAGLFVGVVLVFGGGLVAVRSLRTIGARHMPPGSAALVVIAIAMAVRATMFVVKVRTGRQIGSASLVADAWNDAVDVLSAIVAFVAVWLTRLAPERLLAADHYGGFIVGLVVLITGVRVARDASTDLADTMPDPARLAELERVVRAVDGVLGVEKQLARKTGLQYHVDLHVEVDPDLTVRESHRIAHDVKARVREELSWVADVLVHVEPAPDAPGHAGR